jgi:hypothetical protein
MEGVRDKNLKQEKLEQILNEEEKEIRTVSDFIAP